MVLQKKILLLVFILINCEVYAQRNNFPDVLNLQTTIGDTNNIEKNCFSDFGAWHAYSLPQRKEDYGSFIGPLLMDMNGQWLADNVAQLHLLENGKEINLEDAKASVHYYPGLLQQQLEINGLKIEMKLIFVSNRESLLNAKIINTSAKKRNLEMVWKGTALPVSAHLYKTGAGLLVKFSNNQHLFEIIFYGKEKNNVLVNKSSYQTKNTIYLQPGGRYNSTQVHRYFLQPGEMPKKNIQYVFETELKKNETRWDDYLKKYFSSATGLNVTERKLAVKAIITLMTNWRSKAKDLRHDGVFPSINYQGFYGVWSWDSWKQAVGLSLFNPALAKQNVLCMFDYQDQYGMIADCVYTEKKENNWRDTKPPLAAWAAWNIYEATKDNDFVKEMYPKLVKYHQWWYQYRDHDKNGLCEYGSTDGTRIAAAWESGMDNAVRFDSAVMVKNSAHAFSLNQESVDLNAYLYAEKLYLAKLATALDKTKEAAAWKKEAVQLEHIINKQFFDEEKGFYYDKLFNKNERIRVEGTEGWIPLWAGVASQVQADAVKQKMNDPLKFNTNVPLPTFTADHPKFDPLNGYWRGPVWLDQFYFGIEGLKKYGYSSLADEFVNKLWANAEGLTGDKPIYENYHPLTGKGLNAINFSWSAAHILMLLKK